MTLSSILIGVSLGLTLCVGIGAFDDSRGAVRIISISTVLMVLISFILLWVSVEKRSYRNFHKGKVEIYYHEVNGVVTDTTYKLL